LPLLKLVSNPRVVNPDPALREHAEQAGWPILEWR
jgi:phosphoserine phosphatase